ncbi:hypothetical protein BC831DRAFT_211999 [Entophlyctis helioformis]|nr:hypothetical protein BC831DRAFT_211999 [Entophlyctis helioformis]
MSNLQDLMAEQRQLIVGSIDAEDLITKLLFVFAPVSRVAESLNNYEASVRSAKLKVITEDDHDCLNDDAGYAMDDYYRRGSQQITTPLSTPVLDYMMSKPASPRKPGVTKPASGDEYTAIRGAVATSALAAQDAQAFTAQDKRALTHDDQSTSSSPLILTAEAASTSNAVKDALSKSPRSPAPASSAISSGGVSAAASSTFQAPASATSSSLSPVSVQSAHQDTSSVIFITEASPVRLSDKAMSEEPHDGTARATVAASIDLTDQPGSVPGVAAPRLKTSISLRAAPLSIKASDLQPKRHSETTPKSPIIAKLVLENQFTAKSMSESKLEQPGGATSLPTSPTVHSGELKSDSPKPAWWTKIKRSDSTGSRPQSAPSSPPAKPTKRMKPVSALLKSIRHAFQGSTTSTSSSPQTSAVASTESISRQGSIGDSGRHSLGLREPISPSPLHQQQTADEARDLSSSDTSWIRTASAKESDEMTNSGVRASMSSVNGSGHVSMRGSGNASATGAVLAASLGRHEASATGHKPLPSGPLKQQHTSTPPAIPSGGSSPIAATATDHTRRRQQPRHRSKTTPSRCQPDPQQQQARTGAA